MRNLRESFYSDQIAKFYDLMTGPRERQAKELLARVQKRAPNAKSVLEFGCGTGAILSVFKRHKYIVHGLDSSREMLKIAKKRLPDSQFYWASMTRWSSQHSFDLIISPFDTINHLTKWAAWSAAIRVAANHLSTSGTFVFDMHTFRGLEFMESLSPFVYALPDEHFAITVIALKQKTHQLNSTHRVFHHVRDNTYTLSTIEIPQVSFPIVQVKKLLLKSFKNVDVISLAGKRADESSLKVEFWARDPK